MNCLNVCDTVLGVTKDASKIAIRAAYIQKAKRYHPDVNQSPGAEKLFKAVQEAYHVSGLQEIK